MRNWIGALALAVLSAEGGAAQDAAAGRLSQEEFKRLHELVLPRPGQAKWLTGGIAWMRSLADAQKKAAAEGKALFLLRAGGAGFTDPMAAC
jgi:hypothetical protein